MRRLPWLVVVLVCVACSGRQDGSGDRTVHTPIDAGVDGGVDAGPDDGGTPDAGSPDAGSPDAGSPDAGPDPHKIGGLREGPWPLAPITVYDSAQGLFEAPISASTDEAENLWVVTNRALYLLRPGDKTFRRYTAADGLHYGPGWTDGPDITLVVGGRAGECFIGYYAHDTHNPPVKNAHMIDDPIAHWGKMDQVILQQDLTLHVNRYDFHNSNDFHYWETRTITSAVYDHFQHPGELYVGSNHGVTRVDPAKFRLPETPAEKAFPYGVEKEWFGDHVHPVVCDSGPCDGGPNDHIVFGDFYGLLLADDGRLWMGGLTSAAAIGWIPDLQLWWESFAPYNPFVPAFTSPPVFFPPSRGGNVNIHAIAETMDGLIWFASGETEDWRGPTFGLASWDGKLFKYYDPRSLGSLEYNILELAGWEDKLVLGFPSSGLLVWKPGTAQGKRMGIAQGLPGEQIRRMSIDRMVDPPQLFVPTESGLAVLRSLP
jgi:hypothetical protein